MNKKKYHYNKYNIIQGVYRLHFLHHVSKVKEKNRVVLYLLK